jgi:hypothetical protein
VASRALAGAAVADVGSATHFHTTGVSPLWAPQMLRVSQVGVHVFYRFSPYPLRTLPAAEPVIQQAVLTGAPAAAIPTLHIAPTVEKAVETSLQPAAAEAAPAAKATVAPKPTEAALLQPVSAGS